MDDVLYAGIDTHSKVHALCLINRFEEVVFEGEFAANRTGYRDLERVLGGPELCRRVAIEGCTGYGRGLADCLKKAGYEVREALSAVKRPFSPDGKSDSIDAFNAALKASRNTANPSKDNEGAAQALSYLTISRDAAVKEATACANAVLGCLRSAPEEVRERYERDTATNTVQAVLRARVTKGPYVGVMVALASLARRWKLAVVEADALKAEMDAILKRSYRRLLTLKGVSTITAAAIVASVGDDPKRFKSEAAFAKAAGTCPIPASTAGSGRYRLNRGGDRCLNRAIHQIVIVRLANDKRTKDYMARSLSRGKTRRETIRNLKRYVTRELFKALLSEEPVKRDFSYRMRRRQAGLTVTEVAKRLGTNKARVSRFERELLIDVNLEAHYDKLLDELCSESLKITDSRGLQI